jgi:hypothetical protein
MAISNSFLYVYQAGYQKLYGRSTSVGKKYRRSQRFGQDMVQKYCYDNLPRPVFDGVIFFFHPQALDKHAFF